MIVRISETGLYLFNYFIFLYQEYRADGEVGTQWSVHYEKGLFHT